MFGEDFWVEQAAKRMREGGPFVIPNVRFPNEMRMVRDHSGVIVRVDRPGVGPVNDHISDHLPGTPDVILANDGTLEELATRVHALARQVTRA